MGPLIVMGRVVGPYFAILPILRVRSPGMAHHKRCLLRGTRKPDEVVVVLERLVGFVVA